MKTYEIVEDGQAIKCLVCGMTSWHPKDVEHHFCGKCDSFHDDLASVAELVDARGLGPRVPGRAGSSPVAGTPKPKWRNW